MISGACRWVMVFVLALPVFVEAQEPTMLVGVDRRNVTPLDGEWHAIVDQYATGLYTFHQKISKDGFFMNAQAGPGGPPLDYNFATAPTLKVPGDWNTQRADLLRYEGVMWYEREFNYAAKPGGHAFLHVGAANYHALVWVNTHKICEHEGGFAPFDCEVTSALKEGSNTVVIAVDNTRAADDVPTLQTDWWNYGGLTRNVSLVELPEKYVDDYELHLSRSDHSLIEGYVHVVGAGAGTTVSVAIPELKATVETKTDANSRAAVSVRVTGLNLWSPERPKLYKVAIAGGADRVEEEMGFRTIEVKGDEILLNGRPVFLRGISVHAEAPIRTGRAYSEQDVDTLLGWAKELGCNYVRLAHYPHDERMTRAADRLGIMVWSEIPDYWALEFENPAVLVKSKQQLGEMIRRDRNKASVILWSIANETPNTEARTRFLTTLAEMTKELDPTRLVTAALLVRTEKNPAGGTFKIVDDPLGKALDVIGANEYVGWYEQGLMGPDTTTWQVRYEKPMIMSEWGADARAGRHAGAGENPPAMWTEEYQAELYRHQIGMLNRVERLRGTSPWLLMDFRSPRRVNSGLQDDFNRKGLISDQGVKKQAFFVLQKAYQTRTLGKAQ